MPVVQNKPNFLRFEFRPGAGSFTAWNGHWRDGDPGSVPVGHLRLAVNVNFRSREITERGGQSKLNSSALDGAVRSIFDHQIGPFRLWLSMDGCPNVHVSNGASIGHYDTEQEPAVQRSVYFSTASNAVVLEPFDGYLYGGIDATLKKVSVVKVKYGTENIAISGVKQDVPIETFTGFVIKALKTFDGKLFVGLDAGAGSSKISTYDGTSVRNDLTSAQIPTGFGIYRNQLVVGYASAVGKISYRPIGDSPGTWTDVAAAGAGMIGRGVSYKDKFYFPDGGDDVWVWDQTAGTLTSSLNIPSAVITGIEVAYGFLFAAYKNGTNARIARFDGTSWTTIHKDLTTQVATLTGAKYINYFRDGLYVAVQTASDTRIYKSPDSSTTGTWTLVASGGLALTDINQFTVF